MSENELIKKKNESMELMETKRLNNKYSEDIPSNNDYALDKKTILSMKLFEKNILTEKMNFATIGEKKSAHLVNNYKLEKLIYGKANNLQGAHQSSSSTNEIRSLINGNNPNDNKSNRDCSDCEFDFTYYGSECCDSAWDEYGINCTSLEAYYGWDCSGCACPGDEEGDCGDGNCNINEDCETCEADCGVCGECDAGYVTDCVDDDCCPESWIGDGFEDCVDQAYGCDLTCYDNDGGDCPYSCEDDDLVTCWDGSCAASEGDCPFTCEEQGGTECWDGSCAVDEDCPEEPDCDTGYVSDCVDEDCCPETWVGDGLCDGEDQAWGCDLTCYDNDGGDCYNCEDDGLVLCWDGSCAATEEDCTETDCSNIQDWDTCGLYIVLYEYTCQEVEGFGYDCSYVQDCGLCPWICEDDGLFTCWDNSCVDDLSECPEADCTEAGGVESWISDGYCDSSNNNSNCDWDGGDCCGSTCLVSTYDCVGGGEGSYGACYNECLDPDGNDDCCAENTCPFTCEGNDQVTCWDSSCADTEADCPEITCADTDCGYVLSWSDYTCQDITNNYGYDCTICYESGDCPIECEDEGLVTCWDSSCAATEADCPEFYCDDGYIEDCAGDGDCCPEGWIGDGFADCSDQAYGCDLTCYECDGGDCEESDPGCSTCADEGLVTCWDDSCALTEADCPIGGCIDTEACNYNEDAEQDDGSCLYYDCTGECGGDAVEDCTGECGGTSVICWDGSCVASAEDCPEQPCDDGYIPDCSGDGDCCPESWIADGFEDCEDQQYGCDLTCYDNDGGDCPECGDNNCGDGICNCGETEADCPEDCAASENCLDCEFDFTNYGSECCDSAWDEFGVDCATLEAFYSWDCSGCNCPGDVGGGCENELGDVNGDESINVLDIVMVANHILASNILEDCELDASDYNQDGSVNVLDIVEIANVILSDGGRVHIDDASSAKIIQMDDKVLMNANGYVGAIQMKLQHGDEFDIQLTPNAMFAAFNTNNNETMLIIVAPENEELFIYEGAIEIVEIIVANSEDYIDAVNIPEKFGLHSAYPNPFNPITTISYSLPVDTDVLLQVVDLYGRVVETLANNNMHSGYHAVKWNANSHSSGLYFVKMIAGEYQQTQKLMLVK